MPTIPPLTSHPTTSWPGYLVSHSRTVLFPWFDSYDAKREDEGLGQSDMTVRVDHCAREPAALGSFDVLDGARRSYSLITLLAADESRV